MLTTVQLALFKTDILAILFFALALPAHAVTLEWQDNSDNEAGFMVERSINGGAMSTLATVPADTTTYDDATADTASKFCYVVRSYLDEYVSEPSNMACTTLGAGNLKARK